MLTAGHVILGASVVSFALGLLTIVLGAVVSPTGNIVLDAIVNDTHYKYLAVFVIPTTSYFVIANWVGWQYYRNS